MFDPATKRVWMVFQKIRDGASKRPLYRRLGFNFVADGDNPDRYIEPVNICWGADGVSAGSLKSMATPTTSDRIAGIEYLEGPMSEVHAFPPEGYSV